MTSTSGILPSFQRYINGVPFPIVGYSGRRNIIRPREKHLICIVFLAFIAVCLVTFYFLPELGIRNSIELVYNQMKQAGPEILLPEPSGVGFNFHDMPGVVERPDPHRILDKLRLNEKIAFDEKLNSLNSVVNKVIDKPKLMTTSESIDIKVVSEKKPVAEEGTLSTVFPVIQNGEDKDLDARGKRDKIREMMKFAWDNYVLYAWGKNELKPLSKRPHSPGIFGKAPMGATIVDGLDTLYIMGLNEEYKAGRNWIAENLIMDNVAGEISVFETNIRFIGGLLSCYALTGDEMFKEKAVHVADSLLPAFKNPTGIPNALVNVKSKTSKNYIWASGGSSILSEFGTLHLEFSYLSEITGNSIYQEKVDKIRETILQLDKPKDLYPNYLNPKTGRWGTRHFSIGALGDSFYEYLLKAWIQSGKTDVVARDMYDKAIAAINAHMLKTSQSGLLYISDMKSEILEHKMDHLACFAGGLYALGAATKKDENSDKVFNIGKEITKTCHESYDRTPTKLGPESFRFGNDVEAKAVRQQEKYYILRPEVVESYFILWRLTHDQKYRDWGWEAVQALEKYCRTDAGFTGLKNVYEVNSVKDDVQQSFFLAETLKYLYLLFSSDDLISLDMWVFNTEAHPLPIKHANRYFYHH